jgi:cardiolipin synthase
MVALKWAVNTQQQKANMALCAIFSQFDLQMQAVREGFMPFLKSTVALLSVCLLSVVGCTTTLPDVSILEQNLISSGIPTIIGPSGQVSQREAERTITRLLRQTGSTELLEEHISLMQSLSGHPLTSGNRAVLLVDGPATNEAMLKAISQAKDHINLETFIFADDEVGRQFADLLLQKQTEGIQVNLIYDSIGSMSTPASFFQRLKDGGVNVLEFNPVNPLKAQKKVLVTQRDHRKTMIVDGRISFTGGVNISSVYSKSPSSRADEDTWRWEGWRDTHVKIEGPAVAQFQKLFLETWSDQKGPDLPPKEYFPPLERKGNELIKVIGSTPEEMNRLTYVMYVSAIKKSQDFVHMTMAYFVPDRQSKNVLREAARRGVDVKLVLPSASDSNLTFYAGRSHYEDLLESGVKVYERQSSILHAKTAVIDSVWSTVGSTNFELWSFMRNNEINAIILGVDFAIEMEELFRKDLAESKEISPENWSRRPIFDRMKEFFARLVSHWL